MSLGRAYYQRAQGDLALGQAHYPEALEHYQAFWHYAQQDNHLWNMAQVHAKLGLAHAFLRDRDQARQEMRQGLAAMHAWAEYDMALLAEPLCLIQAGQLSAAAALAAFIAHHPVSWNETKQQARAILETAARGLSEADARLAVEQAKIMELPAVIQQALG